MRAWNIKQNLTFDEEIEHLKQLIESAEHIVIGAGSGLSTAAGFTYGGKRFEENFEPFIQRYGLKDMYSAGFYPFPTQEEKWAYWSKHIYLNRYDVEKGKPYLDLLELISGKDYFVLTTNVDHQFQLCGFDPERIFATQGDYGLFQCAKACHKKLYDNEKVVREMIKEQSDCKIPSSLVPKCPVCGGNMEVNLRCDQYFVEDENWEGAAQRYHKYLVKNKNEKLTFIEIGVGMNTPIIIKYPFWKMTEQFKNTFYICINLEEAWVPKEIRKKSLCIKADIKNVLIDLRRVKYETKRTT